MTHGSLRRQLFVAAMAPSCHERAALPPAGPAIDNHRPHDRARVLGALGAALQKCTACHATFRQQIVDESTWSRMTATGVPMPHE